MGQCHTTQKNPIETFQEFDDDSWLRQTTGISARIFLPPNPYVSNVELVISNIPKEQEQSESLVAELLTNEVAAARIESFTIEYSCLDIMYGGEGWKCSDSLDTFMELINRGGEYFKALNHIKYVYVIALAARSSDKAN